MHDCGIDDAGAWSAIVARYTEPQRAYHSLAHISQMLRLLSTCKPQTSSSAIQLAIWFHDLVYEQPHLRRDLEEQSAADFWAFAALVPLNEELCQQVGDMIMASKQHVKALDEIDQQSAQSDLRLFLNLDLSILAADAATYDAYAESIRIEYNQVPSGDFRTGRRAFLQRMVSACTESALFDVFGAEEGARMRSHARANMERELASLLASHY
jgi:predicted metal-dependent HD superfamily phosphohydrolase